MEIISRHSLIYYTVVSSIVFHLIILFLVPGFISGSSYTYTLRDLTFLVEEVIRIQEKPSQDSRVEIKKETTTLEEKPTPPKELGTPKPTPKAAQNKSFKACEIKPFFNKNRAKEPRRSVGADALSKPELTKHKAGLTPQEARAKLKELEREIGDLSDKERLARIQKEKKYLELVREQLQQHYFVPPTAKHQGMKGEVVLQMTIHQTGQLLDVKILRHSDFPILDMAAKSTVEEAAPFPNIADKVDFPHLNIIVTFQYK